MPPPTKHYRSNTRITSSSQRRKKENPNPQQDFISSSQLFRNDRGAEAGVERH
jgi:hypothetical protein